mgnify:CR=1 FL=1
MNWYDNSHDLPPMNISYDTMNQHYISSGNMYDLLLARLRAVEAEIAALRERVQELEAELHEAEMGGNE